MNSLLRIAGYYDEGLGAIVPHQANLTVPTGGGGGGLGPLGGGGGGTIPPGEQSVAGSGGAGSALNPIGRTTIVYLPGVGQRGTFQPTAQGARITMGTGALATTMSPMGVSGEYPTGGLYSRRMMSLRQPWDAPGLSGLDGLDGFFGDVGNFFGKAIRYVPAAFVAPFAPASFTKRVFGLTPRESKGYEIEAKTVRGVAAVLATFGVGKLAYGAYTAKAAVAVKGAGLAAPAVTSQSTAAALLSTAPATSLTALTAPVAVSTPMMGTASLVAGGMSSMPVAAPLTGFLTVGVPATAPWYAGAGAALLTGAKYVGGTLLVGKVMEGLRAVPGMAPAPQEAGGGGGPTINVEAPAPVYIPVSSGGGGGGGGGEAPVEPEFMLAGMNLPTLLIVGGLGVTVLVTALRSRR